MSKIVLRNVQLINWYGFTNTVVPVAENLTLISGENECGKSTILDAIKYAYTGDTQFNKATSGYNTGVGKRNLISYTLSGRCECRRVCKTGGEDPSCVYPHRTGIL